MLEWKPTPEQAEFAALPWSIKEAFFGGARGGGKSDLLLALPLILKLHTNPNFKQLFLRRTHPELEKEIIPRSRKFYRPFGATWNGSTRAWTFPRPDQYGGTGRANDGAMIFMGHCQHETDVENYDSMEINLFTPDELQSFTEFIYLYIAFSRVRTSDPTLPEIIRGGGMPGNIGHVFVKKRFVDPAPGGSVVIKDKRTGNKRYFVQANFDANPYLSPEYKKSIEELPPAERAAAKGDWNAYLGHVFTEFREFHYPEEPENAIHCIDPVNIPEWWPRIVIGDWGMRAMTWIGFAAISPKGRVYIYRELCWKNQKISDWAPTVKQFIDRENIKLIRFCKSAGQDRGQEHTIQQQISQELNREIELTENKAGSRVAGKMLIHEYLRWKPRAKVQRDETLSYDENFAMSLLRVKGLKEYNDYLNLFVEDKSEDEVLPRLLIFRKECPVLIEAIKACSYDKKKIEDIAEFDGDDPIDALRYLVDAADQYVREAMRAGDELQRREALEKKLQDTQNFTGYYIGMRKLEEKSRMMGVKRYRRH